MSAFILSVSYDRPLLMTRQFILERSGYTVRSAEGPGQAMEACDRHGSGFDLILLGHSIPHEDKVEMALHCRKRCSCPVLALLRPGEEPVSSAEISVEASDPMKMLRAVAAILKRNPGSNA